MVHHHVTDQRGVCLGHQAIGQAFGGRVVRAPPVHGKATAIRHDNSGLFKGAPAALAVGRYHSLVLERSTLPAELTVNAWTDDGIVMGIQHRSLPVWGVQFHPESILTPAGPDLLAQFVELSCGTRSSG